MACARLGVQIICTQLISGLKRKISLQFNGVLESLMNESFFKANPWSDLCGTVDCFPFAGLQKHSLWSDESATRINRKCEVVHSSELSQQTTPQPHSVQKIPQIEFLWSPLLTPWDNKLISLILYSLKSSFILSDFIRCDCRLIIFCSIVLLSSFILIYRYDFTCGALKLVKC